MHPGRDGPSPRVGGSGGTGRAGRGRDRAIDLDELQRAVAATEPSAVLVARRILRRVIRGDRDLRFFTIAAARQTSYAISGASLSGLVTREEINLSAGSPWPDMVYLLERPEPGEQAEAQRDDLLIVAWRRLYRVRVRDAVRRVVAAGSLTDRISVIGRVEFEEASAVLRQDGYVFPESGDVETYAAFAAVFLELSAFAPALLASTFPAVEDPSSVASTLANDVQAASILAATRPVGAPDLCPRGPIDGNELDSSEVEPAEPAEPADGKENDVSEVGDEPHDLQGREKAHTRLRRLDARAREVAGKGNHVRAALLWTRAAGHSRSEAGEEARANARAELKHLANRLQKALFVRKGESELWANALAPLLDHAARGFWSAEARLLFDLQKVCLDHEREIFRLEPLAWLWSWGRRPLKRPLPHLREVTMSNHLRGAARRLARVRITHEERARLEGLLRPAVHRAGDDLRTGFRSRVDEALGASWLRPRGVTERVAYHKLVEELLDQVVGRGFSTLGDLRDAASRSNLKMPDLAGLDEFLKGDQLLAADRALAERLDGVHRPGEVYLRALQRFSALAFGTPVGRFLTLFAVLPFGGAFVALKGLEELDTLVLSHLSGFHLHPVNPRNVAMLGVVALGAINFAGFRAGFLGAISGFGRILRGLFVDLPARILSSPLLNRLLGSVAARAVTNLVVKPGLAALPFWAAARLAGLGHAPAEGAALIAFFAAAFVCNTTTGRALEEVVVEELGRAFQLVVFDLIPGLFRLVMAAFEDLLEWVEKFIYAVDEWLRFRGGQSALVLAAKVILGMVWAVLAYLIRVYVNVLIEPQVNPIKHFPVVTVSHKVILPLSIKLTVIVAAVLTPFLGKDLGTFVAAANVLLLPGVFGFLVWELKSNWRLYEANRPVGLRPIMVGSHGESVVGLLRRGFHSGTLPKQFGRYRRARRDGRDKAASKRRDALHHVEEAVRRFVDREVVALLNECQAVGSSGLSVGPIRLATNRVRVDLLTASDEAPALTMGLEERPWGLVAGVADSRWLSTLDDHERLALNAALLGLFKLCGGERVQKPGDSVDGPPLLILTAVEVPWLVWSRFWNEVHSSASDVEFPRVLPRLESAAAPRATTTEGSERIAR